MQFLDFSTSNSQIIDEIIDVANSNPVSLKKSLFYNKVGKAIVISTAAGGGGTVLTETTDWVAGDAFADGNLPSSIAPDVAYTTIAIVNATYHNTDLYVSYYPIGDNVNSDTLNTLPRIIEQDDVNDISSTTITKTLPSGNLIENGDRVKYKFQDGDGSNQFVVNPGTGWTIEFSGIDIDATAQARIGQGTGQVEFEADVDNKIWNMIHYIDSDAGKFTGTFQKTVDGKMTQGVENASAVTTVTSSGNIYVSAATTMTLPLSFSTTIGLHPITTVKSGVSQAWPGRYITLTVNSVSTRVCGSQNTATGTPGCYVDGKWY